MVTGQSLCRWSVEGLQSAVELGFGPVLRKMGEEAVDMLPGGLRVGLIGPVFFWWETLACPPVIGCLVGLIFILRLVWCVRSRRYGRREEELAKALAAQIEEKCQLIDKVSAAKEECAGMESSLDDARRVKESLKTLCLSDTCTKVTTSYWVLREEIMPLLHQLKEEKFRRSRQEEELAEMLKTIKALEEVVNTSTSGGAYPNLLGGQEPSPGGALPRTGPGS